MKLLFNGRNRVTSPYGSRVLNGKSQYHAGLDIVGDDDKTVHSVCAGTVIQSRIVTSKLNLTWQWGNYVCVRGADGRYYYYCHLDSRKVAVGAKVSEGTPLGIMGNTGYSFGAHTHFEVREKNNKTTVNPAAVLGIANACGTYAQKSANAVQITASSLNVRSAPGTSYAVVAGLKGGDVVSLAETSNGWGYIAAKGWISLDYTKAV